MHSQTYPTIWNKKNEIILRDWNGTKFFNIITNRGQHFDSFVIIINLIIINYYYTFKIIPKLSTFEDIEGVQSWNITATCTESL